MSTYKVGKTVNGTKISDRLIGTNDNDIFRGGGGDDTITGGGGKDTFIFEATRAANGLDTLIGFTSINKSGSEADLLDLSLAITAKNINNNTIGRYVWVVNEKLYVDASGGGIAGGKGAVWANLPGLTGGDKINIRTASYDGPLDVMRFDGPALRLLNDTGSSSSDGITKDPGIATPTGAIGTVEYSLDGTTWSSTYKAPDTDGPYTLYARQTYDGVTSKSSELKFILDTQINAPTASLATDSTDGGAGNDADGVTNSAALTFGTATETVTREYSLDNGTTWTSSYTAPTADGGYTVLVRDTDVAGNTKQGSVKFTLDTDADAGDDLAVSFDSDTVADADKSAIALTVTGLDADVDSSRVKVIVTDKDGNTADATWDAVNSKWIADGTALVAGGLSASVIVTDIAGNTAAGTPDTATLNGSEPAGGDFYISVGRLDADGTSFGAWFDTNKDGVHDSGEQEIGIVGVTPGSDVYYYHLKDIDFSAGDYTVRFVDVVATNVDGGDTLFSGFGASLDVKTHGFGVGDHIIIDMKTHASDWMGLKQAKVPYSSELIFPDSTQPDAAVTGDEKAYPASGVYHSFSPTLYVNGVLTDVPVTGSFGLLSAGVLPTNATTSMDAYARLEINAVNYYSGWIFATQADLDAATLTPAESVWVQALKYQPPQQSTGGSAAGGTYGDAGELVLVGMPLVLGTNLEYLIPS